MDFKKYKEKMRILGNDKYEELECISDEEVNAFYDYKSFVRENSLIESIDEDITEDEARATIFRVEDIIDYNLKVSKMKNDDYELYEIIFNTFKKHKSISRYEIEQIAKDFNKEKNYNLNMNLNTGEWYKVKGYEGYLCDIVLGTLSEVDYNIEKANLKDIANQINFIKNNSLSKKVDIEKWYLVDKEDEEICDTINNIAREKCYQIDSIDLEEIASEMNLKGNSDLLDVFNTDEIYIENESKELVDIINENLKRNNYKVNIEELENLALDIIDKDKGYLKENLRLSDWYLVDKSEEELCTGLKVILDKKKYKDYDMEIEKVAKNINYRKNGELKNDFFEGDWYITDTNKELLCREINGIIKNNDYKIDKKKFKVIADMLNNSENSELLISKNIGEWFVLEGQDSELCRKINTVIKIDNYVVKQEKINKLAKEKNESENKNLLEQINIGKWYLIEGQDEFICEELYQISKNNDYSLYEEGINNLASKVNQAKNINLKEKLNIEKWYLIEDEEVGLCEDIFELCKEENFDVKIQEITKFAESNNLRNNSNKFVRPAVWWEVENKHRELCSKIYKILVRLNFEIINNNGDFETLAKEINNNENAHLLEEEKKWWGFKKFIKHAEVKSSKDKFERKEVETLNRLVDIAKSICIKNMGLDEAENKVKEAFEKSKKELTYKYIDTANKMKNRYMYNKGIESANKDKYIQLYNEYQQQFLKLSKIICSRYNENIVIENKKEEEYRKKYEGYQSEYTKVAQEICLLYANNKAIEYKNKDIYNLRAMENLEILISMGDEICNRYTALKLEEKLHKENFLKLYEGVLEKVSLISRKICDVYFENIKQESENQIEFNLYYDEKVKELRNISGMIVDKYNENSNIEFENKEKLDKEYEKKYKEIEGIAKEICEKYHGNRSKEEKLQFEFQVRGENILREVEGLSKEISKIYNENKKTEAKNLQEFFKKYEELKLEAKWNYENILEVESLINEVSAYSKEDFKKELINGFCNNEDLRVILGELKVSLNILIENKDVFEIVYSMSNEKKELLKL